VPRPDGGGLHVRAVPAVHGPEDGPRDADGNINCEVTGFVLSGAGIPTIYVSGTTPRCAQSRRSLAEWPTPDVAVLFGGAARVPMLFENRPMTWTAPGCAPPPRFWTRRSSSPFITTAGGISPARGPTSSAAFHEAGLSSLLRPADHGTWIPLK